MYLDIAHIINIHVDLFRGISKKINTFRSF
jgi:hypothetical protein